jgi:hypothetical protein
MQEPPCERSTRLHCQANASASIDQMDARERRPERARDQRGHWLPLAEAKQAPPRPAFRAVADPVRPAARDAQCAEAGLIFCADLRVQGFGSGTERGIRLAAPCH